MAEIDDEGVEWLTTVEAGGVIGMTVHCVRNVIADTMNGTRVGSKLRGKKVGGAWVVRKDDAEAYIKTAPYVRKRGLKETGEKVSHQGGWRAELGEKRCVSVTDLTPDLRDEIGIFLRHLIYAMGVTGGHVASRRIAQNEDFEDPLEKGKPLILSAGMLEKWMERIQEEDARQERLRQGFDLPRKRSEARQRRLHILKRSHQQGDMIGANVAADRLQTLDGIAPEMVRIERSIAQATDEELEAIQRRAAEGLSLEAKMRLIEAVAAHLSEEQWNAISEGRRRTIHELGQRAIPAYQDAEFQELEDDL